MAAPIVAYPAIEEHGVIGDRRTAALVASDGTIDWLCLPDYDGEPIFAVLLDAGAGGYWRLGPDRRISGRQRYQGDTFALQTRWSLPEGEVELTDVMLWPESDRARELNDARAIARCLRGRKGRVRCRFDFVPTINFRDRLSFERMGENEIAITGASVPLRLWLGRIAAASPSEWTALPFQDGESRFEFDLSAGDEVWAVLDSGASVEDWTILRAGKLASAARRYWRTEARKVCYTGRMRRQIVRSVELVHLLSYAPRGSLIAAPTTSLPEGTWTADYRFAWVRDASLSLAILAMLGLSGEAQSYMDWLITLRSSNDSPLQVLYGIRGELDLTPTERTDVNGYRGAQPIHAGNQAWRQFQLDSLGYLADCALMYLEDGGAWRPEYWDLVRRCVAFTAASWREPDHGIWELSTCQHYVSSKVMAWVTLDRGVRLAERLKAEAPLDEWRRERDHIRAEVLQSGWSERWQAFKQHYESDNLDASALLIPVMDFLPADDPRVLSTISAVERELSIDGFVYRFVPAETPGAESKLPLGEFEGAFLPCTFWLATSYAKAGQPERAEAILANAEKVVNELGLFAEGVDARSRDFTGNFPLMFSQTEYIRAIVQTAKAQPMDRLRMMPGNIKAKPHLVHD